MKSSVRLSDAAVVFSILVIAAMALFLIVTYMNSSMECFVVEKRAECVVGVEVDGVMAPKCNVERKFLCDDGNYYWK